MWRYWTSLPLDFLISRLSAAFVQKSSMLLHLNLRISQWLIAYIIKYLNAPPGLPSLCFRGSRHPPLSKHGFFSINKVTIRLSAYVRNMLYEEEYACKTINLLLQLGSVRYVTLNADILETPARRTLQKKRNMSTEARNFLLDNSPSVTLIMDGLVKSIPTWMKRFVLLLHLFFYGYFLWLLYALASDFLQHCLRM